MSARDVVATVQVQVAPVPGDPLFKATAETEVIAAMICLKPGQNLFREVLKRGRGRPPKESQESKVLAKLGKFTPRDKDLMLARFAEMLDQLTLDLTPAYGTKGGDGTGREGEEDTDEEGHRERL